MPLSKAKTQNNNSINDGKKTQNINAIIDGKNSKYQCQFIN